MKANWKKVFFWSSLGGLAVGATLAAGRKFRKVHTPPLTYEKMPVECQRVFVWTEQFQLGQGEKQFLAHDEYLFEATQFRLWKVLDLPTPGSKLGGEGALIYHATVIRHTDFANAENAQAEIYAQGRFYGIIMVPGPSGKSPGANYIARGGTLEIHKCSVGGGLNGVLTGEIHRSAGRVLNYRFEYRSGYKPDPGC